RSRQPRLGRARDGGGRSSYCVRPAEEGLASDPQKKGVACAPVVPEIDGKAFEALAQQTKTDPAEWAFPYAAGGEGRAEPKADAPVTEKLGLVPVRVTTAQAPLPAVEGTSADLVAAI